jgi:sulfite reductase beta subunit-like hemoprotein
MGPDYAERPQPGQMVGRSTRTAWGGARSRMRSTDMLRPTEKQLREGIAGHGRRVDLYRQGQVTDDEFRPMRLSYGLYYQLDHTSHMQRIKIPGGLLTSAQMRCLSDVAERLGRGVAHVTTRQDIQIHWVPLAEVTGMYERLQAVGITTRGACADSVRNVTACPHAGLLPGEPFDVAPYALAINDYFLFNPLNLTLPRKFKIAVSNCARDCAQAAINDIGLYAHVRRNGAGPVEGFSVYAAGGLGAQAVLAVRVRELVPADEVLVVCEALVRLQHRAGERKNRSRARMKYLMRKLGPEGFTAALEAEIARVEATRGATLRRETREYVAEYRLPAPRRRPAPAAESNGAAGYRRWRATNVVAQRDPGYYLVTVTLPLGDYTTTQGQALAALADEHGNGTLRTTNEQNLVLPFVSGASLPDLYHRLEAIGLAEAHAGHITDVVSCPGADYCSLAVTRSMGMAERIRRHLAAIGLAPTEIGELHVKISGCPNACGQHHVGDIGLTGMMLRGKDGRERPHYSILVGGGVGEGLSSLGRRLAGRFPEEVTPLAVVAVAECYRAERAAGETFQRFVQRVGVDRLSAAAQGAAGDQVR